MFSYVLFIIKVTFMLINLSHQRMVLYCLFCYLITNVGNALTKNQEKSNEGRTSCYSLNSKSFVGGRVQFMG